jgi:nitrogen PTS system EIIA component
MISLASIMSPERCRTDVEASSQKKIFEKLSKCMSPFIEDSDSATIFEALIEREDLGCTAIGNGIAIPHCRLAEATEIIGCLFRLEEAVEFHAQDSKKVDLIFALIVPQEAHQQHLNVLSQLASHFQDKSFRKKLRLCTSPNELYQTCINNVTTKTNSPINVS